MLRCSRRGLGTLCTKCLNKKIPIPIIGVICKDMDKSMHVSDFLGSRCRNLHLKSELNSARVPGSSRESSMVAAILAKSTRFVDRRQMLTLSGLGQRSTWCWKPSLSP